jgi:hypothetical protein
VDTSADLIMKRNSKTVSATEAAAISKELRVRLQRDEREKKRKQLRGEERKREQERGREAKQEEEQATAQAHRAEWQAGGTQGGGGGRSASAGMDDKAKWSALQKCVYLKSCSLFDELDQTSMIAIGAVY